MAFGNKRRINFASGPLVFVVLLVLSLGLMSWYAKEGPQGFLHRVQANVNQLSAPFQFVSGLGSKAEQMAGQSISDANANAETLSGLRQQNEQLRQSIQQLEEYRKESERLRELLNIKDQLKLEGTSARIIGRGSDSWSQTLTIDKGSADGVVSGAAVMSAQGLLGQVVSVASHSASVRLITDNNSGVSVMVQSSRVEGVVKGSFEGVLSLDNVVGDVSVKPGDVLITSGMGGAYPRGLMVGTVVKVDQRQGEVKPRIVVVPNAQANLLEELIVVSRVGSETTKPQN